jgi:hypothetical protein
MQFHILGTRQDSGEPTETTLQAPDLRAAEIKAGELGILIRKITMLTPGQSPDSIGSAPILRDDSLTFYASLLSGLSFISFIVMALFAFGTFISMALPNTNGAVTLACFGIAVNALIVAAITKGLSEALSALRYIAHRTLK